MVIPRSKYEYQQYKRMNVSTTFREDLRMQLKEFSIHEIHQPETKIYDIMLDYFLNNEDNKQLLAEMVHNYF